MHEPKKVFFENKQGLDLAGHYYPNKDTGIAVIMFHGFGMNQGGPSNYYTELASLLSEKFGVLRFDFQACGESEGHFKDFSIRNYLKDAESALKFMESLGYTEFYLLGHSLGALVALKTSIKRDNVYRVIAIAPPLFVKLPQKSTQDHFKKTNKLTTLEAFKIIIKFLMDKISIQPVRLLNKLDTYTTIIFSYEDKICDFVKTKPKIHDSFFIEWKEIKNADHQFHGKKNKHQLFKIILEELK